MCSEAILCEEASAFARSLWLALVMASKVLFFTELPHRHNVVSSPTFPVFSQHGRGPGDWGGRDKDSRSRYVLLLRMAWAPSHCLRSRKRIMNGLANYRRLFTPKARNIRSPLRACRSSLLLSCANAGIRHRKKEHVVSLASDVKQNNTPQMACPVYRCVYVFGRYLSPGNVLASMIVSIAAAREGSAIDQEIRGLQFCRSKLPAILNFSLGGLSPGR